MCCVRQLFFTKDRGKIEIYGFKTYPVCMILINAVFLPNRNELLTQNKSEAVERFIINNAQCWKLIIGNFKFIYYTIPERGRSNSYSDSIQDFKIERRFTISLCQNFTSSEIQNERAKKRLKRKRKQSFWRNKRVV